MERGIGLEAHGRDKGLGPGDKVGWAGPEQVRNKRTFASML